MPIGRRTALALGAMGVAFGLGAMVNPLLLNKSPSIPVGFYMKTGNPIEVGSTVSFTAPQKAREYALRRWGQDTNATMLKTLGAGPGDNVCILLTERGNWLTINNRMVLAVHKEDAEGHETPKWLWNECRMLEPNEWLPIGTHPDSFDGRYFGPIRTEEITGSYEPFLVFE